METGAQKQLFRPAEHREHFSENMPLDREAYWEEREQ